MTNKALNTVAWLTVMAASLSAACSSDHGPGHPVCEDPNGAAAVTAYTSVCPEVDIIALSTPAPPPDVMVSLSAEVTDLDNDIEQIAFLWTTDTGTVAEPASAVTTYACAESGVATITLTVSDGTCEAVATAEIVCP